VSSTLFLLLLFDQGLKTIPQISKNKNGKIVILCKKQENPKNHKTYKKSPKILVLNLPWKKSWQQKTLLLKHLIWLIKDS